METHNAPARVRRDLVARDVKNMVFVFALVSFLGWCTEMLACYPFSGWQDRGFLTLPFCTIYGTAALFYYYAFGLPQEPRFFKLRVFQPKVFLLDEPLSNLDAKLRAQMRTELTKIHKKVGTTFIYVTHDQVEAMTMASRIVVMKDGIIQQVDTPQNLYDSPCNVFVAGFIGTPQMNFINGTLEKKGEDVYFNFSGNSVKLPAEKAANPAINDYIGKEVIAGLRPECVHDEPMYLSSLSDSVIDVNVEVTELMGAEIYLYIVTGEQRMIARVSSRSQARAGDTIKVALDVSRIHLFDKDTERAILH